MKEERGSDVRSLLTSDRNAKISVRLLSHLKLG